MRAGLASWRRQAQLSHVKGELADEKKHTHILASMCRDPKEAVWLGCTSTLDVVHYYTIGTFPLLKYIYIDLIRENRCGNYLGLAVDNWMGRR